jgi:calcineurin-like phosphoesterase family protein
MTRKIFFTSDLHFGHANVIKYCNRPYATVDEMDDGLIKSWNSTVGKNDKVWILGDVFFCKAERAKEIMHQLHGEKHLILGNHDKMIRNQAPVQKLFDMIHPPLVKEHIDGVTVIMCHYPLLTWEKAHYGSFMLHGHAHGKIAFDPKFRRLDVGVDVHGYAPIAWQDIKRKLDVCSATDVRDY